MQYLLVVKTGSFPTWLCQGAAAEGLWVGNLDDWMVPIWHWRAKGEVPQQLLQQLLEQLLPYGHCLVLLGLH